LSSDSKVKLSECSRIQTSWGGGVVKKKRWLGVLTSGNEEAMRVALVIVGRLCRNRIIGFLMHGVYKDD
jgi:hypothetical protein